MFRVLAVILTVASAASGQYYGDYTCEGGRDVFVQLFEWPWADIGAACPSLAQIGYCAVQVSPPQEHPVLESFPWWQRWQAVSYKMTSRAGDEAAFRSMVTACNTAGVKIYVDTIINHMSGGGTSGVGSAGSYYDAGDEGGQNYTGVPYSEGDFNGRDTCSTADLNVGDSQDINDIRNCRLVSLRDLRLSSPYVQDQVRGYLQKLLDWGVSGFLPSAGKNMWPQDLAALYGSLVGDLFVYQEVLDFGDGPISADEYSGMGRIQEWKYGIFIAEAVKQINGRMLSNLKNIPTTPGFLDSSLVTVFIDNQDTQRGSWISNPESVLSYKSEREYKLATSFMLAFDYGYPAVMSSFNFTVNDASPPSDENGITQPVDCSSPEWVCEHTWPEITNMVKFHNAVVGESVANWWDNGEDAIAFSRGNKAFIAINNGDFRVSQDFQTGLPGGFYCNAYSCDTNLPPCDKATAGCEEFEVNENGILALSLLGSTDSSIVALYA